MKNEPKTIQQLAAESISNLTGIREEKILLWANTHNIDIVHKGYILSKEENWAALFKDVSNNVFEQTNKII